MKYFFQSIKSIIKSYYCWTIILIILLLQNTDLEQRFHIKPFKDLFTFWVLWCKHFSRRELLLKSTNIGFIRVLIADGKLIFVLYVSFPAIWSDCHLHQLFLVLGQKRWRYSSHSLSEQWKSTAPVAFFIDGTSMFCLIVIPK